MTMEDTLDGSASVLCFFRTGVENQTPGWGGGGRGGRRKPAAGALRSDRAPGRQNSRGPVQVRRTASKLQPQGRLINNFSLHDWSAPPPLCLPFSEAHLNKASEHLL